jgi:signal transduction histidine kinase
MIRTSWIRLVPTSFSVWMLLAAVLARPLPAQPPTPAPGPAPGSPRAAQGQADGPLNVLMVWNTTMQNVYITTGRRAFEEALLARVSRPVTIFDETLDLERFPTPEAQQRLQDLVIAKYRDQPIDLIFAVGWRSIEAAREVRPSLDRRAGLDSIPIVYTLDEPGRPEEAAAFPRAPGLTGLVLTSSEMETGQRMRAILPNLRTVAVVVSLPEHGAALTRELRMGMGEGIDFVPLLNPTPEALRVELSALTSPSAVFYYRVLQDSEGAGGSPVDYLRRIAPDSPVPIFSTFPGYLGEGIVGGAIRDPVRHGILAAELVAEILNGADIDTIAPRLASVSEDAYDWTVLQRYDIPVRNLPAGARIIRKPLKVWEEYPRTTAAVSLLLMALTLAVALLLKNGHRLARVSGERRQLARHLLTVQDAERQRIARDLHDDVCQEMSAIAVELDFRESVASAVPSGAMRPATLLPAGPRSRSPLADRLRGLVERTRQVSHGLHAEPFSYAHLPQVLEQEAETLYERHRIVCTVRCDPPQLALLPDITTGVYRIVMEALQNVVKHASASLCTLDLMHSGQTLTVTIRDNGIGLAEAPMGGLGVLSMQERALALGGRLQIASEPFQGTTVTLILPLPPSNTEPA